MSIALTEEQRRAISARGEVVVSASAGSGKTFVMIERLVSLILEGADVRNVLAVTFTNKAAGQMRDRLRNALLKRVGESGEGERARLKEQLKALPLADISTIHAFCSRLVRTHFYLADVDPAFRVISPDDADGALLTKRALDEVFENAYQSKEEGFEELLSVYFKRKRDAKLKELVLSLYAKVRGKSDYRTLLAEMGERDEFERVIACLEEDFRSRLAAYRDEAKKWSAYFAGVRAGEVCERIARAAEERLPLSLFELREMPLPVIPNVPSSAGKSGKTLLGLKKMSKLSAGVKEICKEAAKFAPEETERARYLGSLRLARALGQLLLRFDESYSRLKKEAGVLDYDDLEHCALGVLRDGEVRAALREKYRYLFVDEYQDVNPAQEEILSLIGGEEVFLVGDAKQSIYGFRGSRSEYFLQKAAKAAGSLELTENFRSAPAVLEAVNRVFSFAMTAQTAGIDYRSALMRGGSRYGAHDGAVRFHFVSAEREEKRERGVYSVMNELRPRIDPQAELLCELIEEEVGSEWFDADAGLVKKVGFGDIAVLVRSGDSATAHIVEALTERNIPVATTESVNVCDFWEARLVIDWLSYLDNPEQDIPFAAALLSRVGGFTDAELARIRLRYPEPYTFRKACRLYAKNENTELALKLKAFWERVERYRAYMRVRTAAEMTELLLAEGLEAEIAAKREGENRLRRVRRLAEIGDGSVNAFLNRLKTLSYSVDYAASGGENAVKVVTMHASKGLEYPVVFLVSLDTCFRTSERSEVLVTDTFRFAPKYYDLEKKLVYETVLRRASGILQEQEGIRGELNLLYVAMTRARYRLHLLFRGSESREKEAAISPRFARRFSDFFDFDDCVQYFEGVREAPAAPLPRNALAYRPDPELLGALEREYGRAYPHAESLSLPVKSSATELLGSAEHEKISPSGGGNAVDTGLAYHAFLEHVRFGRDPSEELKRMREENVLSQEQLSLLQEEKLARILALPSLAELGDRRVLREQTFLVSLPACEAMETDAEDEIVFQGAIDLLCEREEGWLILDYKYSSRDADSLRRHYAPQLNLYRKTVARVMGVDERTVRARILNIKEMFEVEM